MRCIKLKSLDPHDAVLKSLFCQSSSDFFDEAVIQLESAGEPGTLELRFENCFHVPLDCNLWMRGQDSVSVWHLQMPETYREVVEKLPAPQSFRYLRLDTNSSGSRIGLVYQSLNIRNIQ